MSRFNWMGGIAATMIVAALTTSATAHAEDGYYSGTLVYTACEQGNLEVCGTRVVGTQCSYTWGFDLGIVAKLIGVEYNGQKCQGSITYNLYKNYERGKNDFGSCVAYPQGQPATRDATEFPSEEGEHAESETC